MAATDYITTVYNRLWAILEGHTPFTDAVRAGNRIKWSANRPMPFKLAHAPADYPEAELSLGQLSDTGFSMAQRFDFTKSFNPAAHDWTEQLQQDYVLRITHSDLRIANGNPVELEALTALRKAGPQLALSGSPLTYVKFWGPVTAPREVGVVTNPSGTLEDTTMRLQTTMTIPVLMSFRGSQLIL